MRGALTVTVVLKLRAVADGYADFVQTVGIAVDQAAAVGAWRTAGAAAFVFHYSMTIFGCIVRNVFFAYVSPFTEPDIIVKADVGFVVKDVIEFRRLVGYQVTKTVEDVRTLTIVAVCAFYHSVCFIKDVLFNEPVSVNVNTSDEVAPLVIAETVGTPAVLGALYLLVKVIVMVFCGSAANPLPCQVTEAVIGVL